MPYSGSAQLPSPSAFLAAELLFLAGASLKAGPSGIMHRVETQWHGAEEKEDTTAYHISDLSHLLGNLSIDPDLRSPDAKCCGYTSSKDWIWAVSSPRPKKVSPRELLVSPAVATVASRMAFAPEGLGNVYKTCRQRTRFRVVRPVHPVRLKEPRHRNTGSLKGRP